MESKQEKRTAIYLTDEEVELFKWFRQHENVWRKARTLRPGRLILHFDSGNFLKEKEFYIRES